MWISSLKGIPLQVLTYKNSTALKPSKILCMLRRHGHGCGKLSYDPPPALHACLDALSEFLQIRTSKESSKLIGLQSSLSRQAGRYKKLSYRKQIARKLSTQYVKDIYSNSVTLKSRNLYTLPVLNAPQGVTPSKFREMFDTHETRMTGLPYGEETMTCYASLTEYKNVTDGQTEKLLLLFIITL